MLMTLPIYGIYSVLTQILDCMIFGGLKKINSTLEGTYILFLKVGCKTNLHRMLEMWSNFVKYLDPTPPSSAASEALAGVQWLPVTAESKQYLK